MRFLQEWIDKGTPKIYWISGIYTYIYIYIQNSKLLIFYKKLGFFFPQAFITGTLQNYARKHVIAIDKLSFEYVVKDNMSYQDVTEKPDDGCYIYGMFLEGARWDSKKHIISQPRPKELYSDFPLMHLVPVTDRKVPTTGIYNCPLYKVVSRRGTLSTTGHSTNFVMFMEFTSKESQDVWIRAGVAAFLALRY
jgi:dynein heavy chain